jgi:hypothetical protein
VLDGLFVSSPMQRSLANAWDTGYRIADTRYGGSFGLIRFASFSKFLLQFQWDVIILAVEFTRP